MTNSILKKHVLLLKVLLLFYGLSSFGQSCPNGTSMVLVDVSLSPTASTLHVFPWTNGSVGAEGSCNFGSAVPEEGVAYNETSHKFYFIGFPDQKLYVYNGITKSIESSFTIAWPGGNPGRTWQVELSPDGNFIYVGTNNGLFKIAVSNGAIAAHITGASLTTLVNQVPTANGYPTVTTGNSRAYGVDVHPTTQEVYFTVTAGANLFVYKTDATFSSPTLVLNSPYDYNTNRLGRGYGLSFKANGNFWVAIQHFVADQVREYTAGGSLVRTISLTPNVSQQIYATAVGPDGDLYIGSGDGACVFKVSDGSGLVSVLIPPAPNSWGKGLAFVCTADLCPSLCPTLTVSGNGTFDVCQNATVTFEASTTASTPYFNNLNWYLFSTNQAGNLSYANLQTGTNIGSNGLGSTSGNYTKSRLFPTNGTYYVYAILSPSTNLASNCQPVAAYTINVTDVPAPTAQATQPACVGETGSIEFTSPTNNPMLPPYEYSFDNGSTYQPSPIKTGLSPGTYTLRYRSAAGCVSPSISVPINAASPVTPPGTVPAPPTDCPGANFTLTASGCSTYRWFGPNGAVISTGAANSIVVSPGVTSSYQVACLVGICESIRQSVTVPVKASPGLRTDTPTCRGANPWRFYAYVSSTTVTFTSSSGTVTLVGTTQYEVSVPQATPSVIITATLNGCVQQATINKPTCTPPIYPPCSQPTSDGGSRCGPGTLQLTATGCGPTDELNWTTVPTPTDGSPIDYSTFVGTGGTFTTPSISGTTTYYIHCFNDVINCRSESTPVEATVFPIASISGVTVNCVTPNLWSITGTRSNNATISLVESMSGVSITYPSPTTFLINNIWPLYFSVNVVAVYPSLPCPGTTTPVSKPATCSCEIPSSPNQTICGTQNVSLIASGCTGTYNWYSDEYTNTILHTGATYTSNISGDVTYYITCTAPSGCISNRVPVSVDFNEPVVGGSAGVDLEVCQVVGSFTSIPVGSIKLSGHSGTITGWQLATGNGAWGANNNTVDGVNNTINCCFNPGFYYVRAVINNNNICGEVTSTPAKITVKPVTLATAGSNSPLCTGSNALLSAFAIGATGYAWAGSSGSFNNPNIANPTVSGLAIGTHTFTVTISMSGCTNTATTSVQIQECACTTLSDIQATIFPTAIGLNGNASLDVTGTGIIGGTAFNWAASPGSPTFTTSIKNPTISNFTTAGGYSYTVTVTNANGTGVCTATAITSLTVTIALPPCTVLSNLQATATPSSISTGNNSMLDVTGTGIIAGTTTFAWAGTGGFTGSIKNPSTGVLNTAGGYSYTVTATNANGTGTCSATAITSLTVCTSLSGVTASASPPNILARSSSMLNVTGTGVSASSSFTWVGPAGFSAAIQNPSTGILNSIGTYSYTVTVSNGLMCSATSMIPVMVACPVLPTPVVNDASRCGTGIITFNFPTNCGAGSSLKIYTDPLLSIEVTGLFTIGVSSIVSPSISNTTPYYAICQDNINASCRSSVDNFTGIINIIPSPMASGAAVCETENINLSSSGGTAYAWFAPDGFSSALQNPVRNNATLAMAGVYTVTVYSGSGCSASITTTVLVTAKPFATIEAQQVSCNGNIARNDAKLILRNQTNTSRYGYSEGNNYTGPAYNGASNLPANNELAIGLSNPTLARTYTVRVFNTANCYEDFRVNLQPKSCVCPPAVCLDMPSTRIK